jgi:hypothetical protein
MKSLPLGIILVLGTAAIAAEPPPSVDEQKRLIEGIRENALSYTLGLPDYICTQTTERKMDPGSSARWRTVDTIEEQLSFVDRKENYKVTAVNGRPVTGDMDREALGGSTSAGEFGGILLTIFHPRTHTEFDWVRWTAVHKHPAYVFAYKVRDPRYELVYGAEHRTVDVGFHGRITVDRDTFAILRIEMQCDDIPPGFPITHVELAMDYDFVQVNGRRYVLPVHMEMHSSEPHYSWWNQTNYTHYRKFGADANISFDADPQESTPPPIRP